MATYPPPTFITPIFSSNEFPSTIDTGVSQAELTTALVGKLNYPVAQGAEQLAEGSTATTQSSTDNSTKIATTAYVKSLAVAGTIVYTYPPSLSTIPNTTTSFGANFNLNQTLIVGATYQINMNIAIRTTTGGSLNNGFLFGLYGSTTGVQQTDWNAIGFSQPTPSAPIAGGGLYQTTWSSAWYINPALYPYNGGTTTLWLGASGYTSTGTPTGTWIFDNGGSSYIQLIRIA
jgi:hypothetical protein